MKKNLFLSFMFVLLAISAFAQDRTISGRVTDTQGNPVPGAVITVKGSPSIGTSTDANGNYTLKVPTSAIIMISGVGMQNQEFPVASRTNFDSVLAETTLGEVVVVGYQTLEKREITGAISSIKGDVIRNLPVQSFDRALQGRAAGVLVQGANGVPGGAITVRIRGTGSLLAGNEPLYVVDGVQINNRSDAGFLSSNPLAFLNPNDIESMEILKDAAAGAIYGSQAANGVILITTKRGKENKGKTQFTFNYYRGIVEPIKQLKVLNAQQYQQVRMEAIANTNAITQNNLPTTLASYMAETRFLGTGDQLANLKSYNWQNETFRYGSVDNYELAASGANDKFDYYISGAFNKQDASTRNSDFQRGTLKLNLGYRASPKLKLSQDISFSTTVQTGPLGGAAGGSFLGEGNFSSPLILPFNPVYLSDGSYNGLSPNSLVGLLGQNVVAVTDYNINKSNTVQMVGSFKGIYEFTKNLRYSGLLGLDYRFTRGERYTDPRTADGFVRSGLLQSQSETNSNWMTSQTLTYNKTFNKRHDISALFGLEYRQEIYQGINLSADNFPTQDFNTPDAAANPLNTGGFWTSFRRFGSFLNVKYDLDQKYIISGILRYDGSSRFGTNNLFGLFPSVSAAWAISNEEFLKDVSFIKELKLRLSYGKTGNDQVGNFASRGLYGAGFSYNGQGGVAPTSLANPDLKWEVNQSYNAGLDYSLWNGKVSGSIDYFIRDTKDLLLARPLPVTSGYGSITQNVGTLRNQGWEFEITTKNVTTDDFSWETSFNFTYIDNRVTDLFDGLKVLPGDNSVRVGYPVGTIFGLQYAGVHPALGRPMYYDRFGNLVYQPVFARDAKVLGNTFAEFYGGLNNTFKYKGFEASAFFQYEFGRDAVNGQGAFMAENGGRSFNSETRFFENRWTVPGQITSVPRPFNNNTEVASTFAGGGSSRFTEDASYIRLKQLNFAYTLPSSFLERSRMSSVRLYVQALNLITFTKWTGFDPEFTGANTGTVPQSRNYTVGIVVGF
jgi:TonB-dependent starch-binding outer membrane protein SusC